MAFEWVETLGKNFIGDVDYDPGKTTQSPYQSKEQYNNQVAQEKRQNLQSRKMEQHGANYFADIMEGKKESIAQRQMRQGRDSALKTALAQQAGARGTGVGLASQSTARAHADMQSQANRQAAILRAQEQNQAASQYAALSQAMRMQDLQERGYSLEEAKAILEAQANEKQLKMQGNIEEAKLQQGSSMFAIGAAAGALGGLAGISDARAKNYIQPITSDARAKTGIDIYSDVGTKEDLSGIMPFVRPGYQYERSQKGSMAKNITKPGETVPADELQRMHDERLNNPFTMREPVAGEYFGYEGDNYDPFENPGSRPAPMSNVRRGDSYYVTGDSSDVTVRDLPALTVDPNFKTQQVKTDDDSKKKTDEDEDKDKRKQISSSSSDNSFGQGLTAGGNIASFIGMLSDARAKTGIDIYSDIGTKTAVGSIDVEDAGGVNLIDQWRERAAGGVPGLSTSTPSGINPPPVPTTGGQPPPQPQPPSGNAVGGAESTPPPKKPYNPPPPEPKPQLPPGYVYQEDYDPSEPLGTRTLVVKAQSPYKLYEDAAAAATDGLPKQYQPKGNSGGGGSGSANTKLKAFQNSGKLGKAAGTWLLSDKRSKNIGEALDRIAAAAERMGVDAEETFDEAPGYTYRYKEGAAKAMGTDTEPRAGIMAQDLNKTPAGKAVTYKTDLNGERRWALDGRRALGLALAGTSQNTERLDRLEALIKKNKGKVA